MLSDLTLKLLEDQQFVTSVEKPPLIPKKNCSYIVSAILIEQGKVLLISEAKWECRGKWYLPAGRVEPNETLNESFKRELIEESFIEGEPDHLVSIEYNLKDKWFRFNFIGHKTGGRLKTLADQDKESLEARWFDVNEVLERKIDLRAYDILQVLKDAVEWLSSQSRLLFKSLPIHRHTGTLTLRIFVINDQLQLLVDGETLQIPEQPLLSKNLSYLSVIKLNAAFYISGTTSMSKSNTMIDNNSIISSRQIMKNKEEVPEAKRRKSRSENRMTKSEENVVNEDVKSAPTVNDDVVVRKLFEYEEQEACTRDSKHDVELFQKTCRNIEHVVAELNEINVKGDNSSEMFEKRMEAVILATNLKKLNRFAQMRGKDAAEKTQQAKSKVDGLHLQLQNLLYEVMHIKKEIQKCVNFSSKDEDIELIDVDSFYKDAPKDISKPNVTRKDSHQQMIARLDWELKCRKELYQQKSEYVVEKQKIEAEIAQKTEYLTSLKPQLANIIKSTIPVQEFMGLPLEAERIMFESAQYLPRPLYFLYIQAQAYKDACEKDMKVEILGDVAEAKADFNVEEQIILEDTDESDAENTENADAIENNTERRRKHKKESEESRLRARQKQLLKTHPLAVRIVLSKEARYDLSLTLHYLVNLHICSVEVDCTLKEVTNSLPYLLSSDILLRDLLTPDTGNESPNGANKYQLEKVGLRNLDGAIVGVPYFWVQWICGLNYLPNKELPTNSPDSLLSMKHFQPVVKAIHTRLKARLSLQKQLEQFEALQLPGNTGFASPPKVSNVLSSWRNVTYEDFMQTKKRREMAEADVVSSDCMFFYCTLTSTEATLAVHLVIHPNYPQQAPLFFLALKGNENMASLRCLEQEVNVFTDGLSCPDYMLLSAMLHKLQVCFDMFLETGRSYSTKDMLYARKTRGRDRNRPFHYHKDGYFVHR